MSQCQWTDCAQPATMRYAGKCDACGHTYSSNACEGDYAYLAETLASPFGSITCTKCDAVNSISFSEPIRLRLAVA